MARVVKPGGHVGVNESIWTRDPPSEVADLARDMGAEVKTPETWRLLCAAGRPLATWW